jgi:hypothetical protein
LIEEEFGDSFMSAIDFGRVMEREPGLARIEERNPPYDPLLAEIFWLQEPQLNAYPTTQLHEKDWLPLFRPLDA